MATAPTHAGAAAGDRSAHRPQVGGDARADLAAERAEGVGQHLDAGEPAAHRLGDGLAPDGAAEDARDHVGGARQREHHHDQPERRHQAGQPRRNAPYDAAATTIARPWWWKRVGPAGQHGRDHGADGLGRVEQPEQLRPREDLLGERGEQHHRQRHQHAGDVDEVGAEQVAAPEGVAHALADSRQARRGGLGAVRVVRASAGRAASRRAGRSRRRRSTSRCRRRRPAARRASVRPGPRSACRSWTARSPR